MKKINFIKGYRLCAKYRKMDEAGKNEVRAQRLRDIVAYAKENSPYYKALYRNLPDRFSLTDLPPVNKADLMAHFDEWITDRSVKLADIEEFMQDSDHIGRKFLGQYLIFTTSGSTGNPMVALYDDTTNNIVSAMTGGRVFARRQDMMALLKRAGKTIGVFATGGFYLAYGSVRARLLAAPWRKRISGVTSALLPIPQIVNELNAFQPAMLGGYPTVLELLIDEQKSGRLHIKPVLIMTGGEYLSDELRERLSKAFGCYVQTSYSCTESGTIGCECTERHFHINDDWVIIEPVDAHNVPVPDGVQSDKILLTNLFNFAQPFIRYEVTDRVVMHHERCACGNPSPWLTLEGRTDDIVIFTEGSLEIKIAPLALYATLKEIHEIRRFQLVARKGNRLELRIVPADGYGKDDAFQKARETLIAFLATHGVLHTEIVLADVEPMQHPKSGKFKHIINISE